jgi:hypothetical protein
MRPKMDIAWIFMSGNVVGRSIETTFLYSLSLNITSHVERKSGGKHNEPISEKPISSPIISKMFGRIVFTTPGWGNANGKNLGCTPIRLKVSPRSMVKMMKFKIHSTCHLTGILN